MISVWTAAALGVWTGTVCPASRGVELENKLYYYVGYVVSKLPRHTPLPYQSRRTALKKGEELSQCQPCVQGSPSGRAVRVYKIAYQSNWCKWER